jgi:hypothetical protein
MAIRMSTNEKKSIKFDIAIAGTDISELKGRLKIRHLQTPNMSEAEVKAIATVNNVEYGFPIIINTDKTIEAEIPPLDEFIKKNITDGSILKAKLEIVAGDTYMVPWEDTINIEVPVAVEATVTETTTIDEKKKMSISVKNIMEVKEEPKKVVKVKPKSKFGKTLEG